MPNAPHVVSFNFTKNIFYEQSWDDVVVKARGLFINHRTGEIVARSYDKFFNVNERDETKPETLYTTLQYPVRAWRKENGFLGIAGYDAETDSLFTASKSTSAGEFADMFREILFKHLEGQVPNGRLKLARDLRDMEASLAFEVIDPVRDPHIVEYGETKVVLLDVIRRSTDFEKMDDRDRERFAKKYGFETKKLEATLPNSIAITEWSRRMGMDMNKLHEGWVLEDAKGFQWKQKSPYYAFWKWMRSAVDAAVRSMQNGQEPNIQRYIDQAETRGLDFLREDARNFLEWAVGWDREELEAQSIIALRRKWMDEGKPRNLFQASPAP
jgi:tRNA splicing ligase